MHLYCQCDNFHKKTLVNLFRISFYKFLNIINMFIFAMLTKLWLVFFFLKNMWDPKSEKVHLSIIQIRSNQGSKIFYPPLGPQS